MNPFILEKGVNINHSSTLNHEMNSYQWRQSSKFWELENPFNPCKSISFLFDINLNFKYIIEQLKNSNCYINEFFIKWNFINTKKNHLQFISSFLDCVFSCLNGTLL